jgi:D-3-phosphoglycerate dehydrogenase / 2-oxoglutarate reductase
MVIMDHFRVAITVRSFNSRNEVMEKLRSVFAISYINESGQRLEGAELINALRDADAVIAGTERFSASVLASSPRLKAISRVGVGLDSIDRGAAAQRNICIYNTPEAPVQAVAEHTLALIFSLLKHIPQYYDNMRNGEYSTRPGELLFNKTVGIIGMGRIGRKTASLLSCLGCDIVFFDPFYPKHIPREWKMMQTLRDLLARADIVTIHASPQEGEGPLLDAEAFTYCKKGTLLINTARGTCIDEDALFGALMDGRIGGAGLDVSSTEPLKGSLLSLPQVIATPHIASNARETREQMESEAVTNLINWRKGLKE